MDDLATFLDSQSTKFTIAVNLWKGYLPESSGRAAAIFETGGIGPAHTFASRVWERPRVQVICRSTRPSAASPASASGVRALIETAWRTFDTIANSTLSSIGYLRVVPVQSPFLLEIDSRGRQVWSFSADVMKRSS